MSAAAEKAIRDWTAARFPNARVVTETPSNLETIVPCIQVVRIGGTSSIPTIDDANVDVDYFAATRELAREGAQAVRRAYETEMPGAVVGGNTVLAVSEISAPSHEPYSNTNLRRFSATYRISLHTD